VCNKTHTVDQRAARWLLTSGDRVRNDQFVLTQEFLGQMLGVTRPTVSETANKLRTEKLISYSRGHITLLDRPGLLRITCECYQIIKEEFDTISRHMP
jgi:CRP-like cAMP-binding protein